MQKIFIIILALGLFLPQVAWGEMSSANYRIYSDSVGMNGGDVATGGSYTLTDTIGESTGIGIASSTTYNVNGGFQAATLGSLSFSLDTNALNLGTASTTAVSSATATATITCTDAGYNLSITNVNGIMPQAVADGTVTAGVEEYGMAVSGPNQAFVNDQAVVTNLTLASAPAPVLNDQEALTFKAAISPLSTPGTYSQTIDLMVTAAF